MMDEKNTMYARNEMNQSNSSKVLSKIENPLSIIKLEFRVWKYENIDEKMRKKKRLMENNYNIKFSKKAHCSDALKSKHIFEIPYISFLLDVLKPTS